MLRPYDKHGRGRMIERRWMSHTHYWPRRRKQHQKIRRADAHAARQVATRETQAWAEDFLSDGSDVWTYDDY